MTKKYNCQALIIACIDYRLVNNTQEYIKKLGLTEKCDLLCSAGSSLNIARPQKEEYREFMMSQIKIATEHHNIKHVIIIHHEDCGAYGGKEAFKSDEDEKNRHIIDMQKSAEIIREKYPYLILNLVYARLNGTFEKI